MKQRQCFLRVLAVLMSAAMMPASSLLSTQAGAESAPNGYWASARPLEIGKPHLVGDYHQECQNTTIEPGVLGFALLTFDVTKASTVKLRLKTGEVPTPTRGNWDLEVVSKAHASAPRTPFTVEIAMVSLPGGDGTLESSADLSVALPPGTYAAHTTFGWCSGYASIELVSVIPASEGGSSPGVDQTPSTGGLTKVIPTVKVSAVFLGSKSIAKAKSATVKVKVKPKG